MSESRPNSILLQFRNSASEVNGLREWRHDYWMEAMDLPYVAVPHSLARECGHVGGAGWSLGMLSLAVTFYSRFLCAVLVCISQCAFAAQPMVAAGGGHSLAFKTDGTIVSFGTDLSGELGTGRLIQSPSPRLVAGIPSVKSVTAGNDHVLALTGTGTVWGWGRNTYGAAIGSTPSSAAAPQQVSGLTTIVAIDAGVDHSLALAQDGTIWAWGRNVFNTLGDGTQTDRSVPAPVQGLSNVIAIAAGSNHNLALRSDGTVWAWGFNHAGALGDGTKTDRSLPVQVRGLDQVVAVGAGFAISMALKRDGTVWAWGDNWAGQLGDGTTVERHVPVKVGGLPSISKIFVNETTTMAIAQDGASWTWGGYQSGTYTTPQRLSGVAGAAELQPDNTHFLARLANGTVLAWGNGNQGQIGNGRTDLFNYAPIAVPGVSNAVSVAAGRGFSVAVTQDGSVLAWGSNSYGQLGQAIAPDRTVPSRISSLSDVIAISAGQGYSLALRRDGTVWMWGNLTSIGDPYSYPLTTATPIQVPGLTGIVAISAGDFHNLCLKSDGTVWAFGSNSQGGLGRGNATPYYSLPVQIPGLDDIVAIQAGQDLSVAVRRDGSLWYWGRPGFSGPYLSPAQALGLTNIVAATLGGRLLLKGDGTVWEWVYSADTLRQVAGLANVSAIFAGYGRYFALRSDGTLWGWGRNNGAFLNPATQSGGTYVGLIGNGDITTSTQTAPVLIPVPTPVIGVSVGVFHTLAVAKDGTTLSWGLNFSGQLGDGTVAQQLTPVLVVNETVDGFLDLIPEVPNNIPPDKIPPFLVVAHKSGGVTATSLAVDIKGPTAGGSFASATDFGNSLVGTFAAGGYNVYVAAGVPTTGAPLYFQLDSNNNWSALRWPMAEFLRGVALDSQNAVVRAQILQNVDLSQFIGTSIIVGYGTDPDEMVRNACYRTIFTVSQQ